MEKKREKIFKMDFLSDNYMEVLSDLTLSYDTVDDIYFVRNNALGDEKVGVLKNLKYLFMELNRYVIERNIYCDDIFGYFLKYKNNIYFIDYNGEGFSCSKFNIDNFNEKLPLIDYKDFKKWYERI